MAAWEGRTQNLLPLEPFQSLCVTCQYCVTQFLNPVSPLGGLWKLQGRLCSWVEVAVAAVLGMGSLPYHLMSHTSLRSEPEAMNPSTAKPRTVGTTGGHPNDALE